jgi:hypothetical protein
MDFAKDSDPMIPMRRRVFSIESPVGSEDQKEGSPGNEAQFSTASHSFLFYPSPSSPSRIVEDSLR